MGDPFWQRRTEDRSAPLRRGPSVAGALAEGLAKQADVAARSSEKFAELLERAAPRGDSARRMAIAAWERDVARVERYNAARLRSRARPLGLKPFPRIPLGAQRPD
jgi:hypothetical protein